MVTGVLVLYSIGLSITSLIGPSVQEAEPSFTQKNMLPCLELGAFTTKNPWTEVKPKCPERSATTLDLWCHLEPEPVEEWCHDDDFTIPIGGQECYWWCPAPFSIINNWLKQSGDKMNTWTNIMWNHICSHREGGPVAELYCSQPPGGGLPHLLASPLGALVTAIISTCKLQVKSCDKERQHQTDSWSVSHHADLKNSIVPVLPSDITSVQRHRLLLKPFFTAVFQKRDGKIKRAVTSERRMDRSTQLHAAATWCWFLSVHNSDNKRHGDGLTVPQHVPHVHTMKKTGLLVDCRGHVTITWNGLSDRRDVTTVRRLLIWKFKL